MIYGTGRSGKKILAAVLALALLLCACARPASVAESGASAEQGVPEAEETIRIGFTGALSGPGATLGMDSLRSAELAVRMRNEAGGVLGRQVELISCDDEGRTDLTVRNVTRLIREDGVCAFIGTHLSEGIMAASDISEEAHVVQIGPGTSGIWADLGLRYTFRPNASSDLFSEGTYDSMARLGATRVATLTADTDYARNAARIVTSFVANDPNMLVVAGEEFTTGETEFREKARRILAKTPDAVLINCGSGAEGGRIVRTFRELGYRGYLYGIEAFADREFIKVAGEASNGLVMNCSYFVPFSGIPEDARSDREYRFLLEFREAYGTLPSTDTAYRSFDGMNILLEAIELAGSTDGDAVRRAVIDYEFDGIGGHFDYTDGSVEGLEYASSYIFQYGSPVPLEGYLAGRLPAGKTGQQP